MQKRNSPEGGQVHYTDGAAGGGHQATAGGLRSLLVNVCLCLGLDVKLVGYIVLYLTLPACIGARVSIVLCYCQRR